MHPLDSAGIGVAGNGYASSDRLFDKDDHYQNGAPTWYTIGDIPMLRMNFNNDLISSITENNTAIFNVFPNPTNGVFTINSDFDSKYTIEVRNIIGELIYTTSTTELEKTIDLSKFGKGVYTVEIINKENIIQTEKIILE